LIFLSFYHSFQTRPGSWVLTGSLGQLFFLKSKRRYFCKNKNKSQRVATGSLGQPAGLAGSHWVFPSPIFFFNPARFQPRVGLPGRGRISKLCILHLAYLSLFFIFIFRNIFLVFIFFSLHFFWKKNIIFYFLYFEYLSLYILSIYIYIYFLSYLYYFFVIFLFIF